MMKRLELHMLSARVASSFFSKATKPNLPNSTLKSVRCFISPTAGLRDALVVTLVPEERRHPAITTPEACCERLGLSAEG